MTMTKQQLDQLHQILEQRRKEILQTLTRAQKEGRGLHGDYPQDMGDRSVTSFSKELLFHQSTERHMLLRSIEAALERIDNGTFGECISCGEQISAKRLEAMPFTAYCRDCQERLEDERNSAFRRAVARKSA
jgi:DnaK suppressor protein